MWPTVKFVVSHREQSWWKECDDFFWQESKCLHWYSIYWTYLSLVVWVIWKSVTMGFPKRNSKVCPQKCVLVLGPYLGTSIWWFIYFLHPSTNDLNSSILIPWNKQCGGIDCQPSPRPESKQQQPIQEALKTRQPIHQLFATHAKKKQNRRTYFFPHHNSTLSTQIVHIVLDLRMSYAQSKDLNFQSLWGVSLSFSLFSSSSEPEPCEFQYK